MKLDKKILFSKKFIIFLFMLFCYVLSSASEIPSGKSAVDGAKKNFQNIVVLTVDLHNLNQYYISTARHSAGHNYEIRHEERFYLPAFREFLSEDREFYFEKFIFDKKFYKTYNIATDVNRSLRR